MNFIKKHKILLIILSLLILISIMLLVASPEEDKSIQPSDTKRSNESAKDNDKQQDKGNKFVNDTSIFHYQSLPKTDSKSIELVQKYLSQQPTRFKSINLKGSITVKEVENYSLLYLSLYDNETNIAYTDVAIVSDKRLITGVGSYLSADDLISLNVPEEIVKLYEQDLSDI